MKSTKKWLTSKNFSHSIETMNFFFQSNFLIWFLLLFCMKITISQNLDYGDLQFTGAACSPKDTCNRPTDLPFLNRTCECDNQCSNYGDCCIDSESVRRLDLQAVQIYECLAIESNIGVYAVSKCHRNWNGSEDVRLKCEEFGDMSNPLASAPATDVIRSITYKNRYCAQCNNAKHQDLRSWEILVECDTIPDNTSIPVVNDAYIEDNLIFLTENSSWGFFYSSDHPSSEERKFYPCETPFKFPNSLNESVRYCRPNAVSTCAESWYRNSIRRTCMAYMAVVYVSGEVYRNPHCALCNNKSFSGLSCTIPGKTIVGRGKKPAASFTLLMDVNMSDGNRVGEVSDDRCPANQQWDPFAKKCRTASCAIPGYVMQNGGCVPP